MQIIVFKTLKSGKNLYLYLYRPSPTYSGSQGYQAAEAVQGPGVQGDGPAPDQEVRGGHHRPRHREHRAQGRVPGAPQQGHRAQEDGENRPGRPLR